MSLVLSSLYLPDELLIQHTTLRSQPRVPKRNIQSLSNWLSNVKNAILEEEAGYINQRHDLVQLGPKSNTPLRQLLERSSYFRLWSIWKKAPPKDAIENFPHPETLHYSSDSRIDSYIGITITIFGMIMLIIPLWILTIIEGTMKRLGVITGFVVLFLCFIAFTSVAKPFESLAAAAA